MSKPRGHYCRICGQHKANEKFSGRGHAAHICKACAKRGNKPPEVTPEPPVFIDTDDIDDFGLYPDFDSFLFDDVVEETPPKPKKKRKPNKAKLLRSAQKKQAKELLSRMLNDGDVLVKDITEAANKAKIPTEALRRAKGSLAITSVPTENGSIWHLPPHRRKIEVSAENEKSETK
jgi:hypothetical protein